MIYHAAYHRTTVQYVYKGSVKSNLFRHTLYLWLTFTVTVVIKNLKSNNLHPYLFPSTPTLHTPSADPSFKFRSHYCMKSAVWQLFSKIPVCLLSFLNAISDFILGLCCVDLQTDVTNLKLENVFKTFNSQFLHQNNRLPSFTQCYALWDMIYFCCLNCLKALI